MASVLDSFVQTGQLLQGTDGVRGPIDLHAFPPKDAVAAFIDRGTISPAFIELNCRAFARMCLRTRKARRGDAVVFADDGRDFYREQVLRTACMRGFAEEGLRVLDIGVAP
ncbi:MAG TPA: hypothetical protein VL860_06970, partial [Planctomycetota bacterium]|nr:hypothetical protein [Planctomycetota bacterium]